jgi:CrcB protein
MANDVRDIEKVPSLAARAVPVVRAARRRLSFGSAARNSIAAVAIGGGVGSVLRYEIGLAIPERVPPSGFPTTTLSINLVGALALGAIVALVLEHWPPTRYVRPFVAIGMLGGFTTFSTFSVEVDRLLGGHRFALAGLYVGATLVLGVLAVWAGSILARLWPLLFRRRR